MSRPRALDLFCCAGGITVGLERAGFDVIGVDWKPNPHWCGAGECHEADLSTAEAVEAVIRAFAPDFVTASPPCQRFSTATPQEKRASHPNLISSTREGIRRSGVPGWIENVEAVGEHLTGFWIMLCGSHFDLRRLKRHRRFELIGWRTQQPYHDSWACMYEPSGERRAIFHVAGEGSQPMTTDPVVARKRHRRLVATVAGDGGCAPGFGGDKTKRAEWRRRKVTGVFGFGLEGPGQEYGQNRPGPECIRWREAMGWLDGPRDRYSLAQAIPPAYGEWLGRRFLERTCAIPESPEENS